MTKHLVNILGAITDIMVVIYCSWHILDIHATYVEDLILGFSDHNEPAHIFYATLVCFIPIILVAILAFFIDIYDEYKLIIKHNRTKVLKRKHNLYETTLKDNDKFIESEAGKLYDEENNYIADLLP